LRHSQYNYVGLSRFYPRTMGIESVIYSLNFCFLFMTSAYWIAFRVLKILIYPPITEFQTRKAILFLDKGHTSPFGPFWGVDCVLDFGKTICYHGEALALTGKIASFKRILPLPHSGHILTSMPVTLRSRSCQFSIPLA
jgi:hypothetical protein